MLADEQMPQASKPANLTPSDYALVIQSLGPPSAQHQAPMPVPKGHKPPVTVVCCEVGYMGRHEIPAPRRAAHNMRALRPSKKIRSDTQPGTPTTRSR